MSDADSTDSTSVSASGYVCTLDEATLKIAEDELNENVEEREKAMVELKKWIQDQPYLRCRTDPEFLISYLRGAKFDQQKARRMVEGTMMAYVDNPHWFFNIDTCDPKLHSIIRSGCCLPLPGRDKNGCRIMYYNIGGLDTNKNGYTFTDFIHGGMVAGVYSIREEEVQVRGTTFIFDFTGISLKHMSFFSVGDMRRWHQFWHDNLPGRYKAFHYYNMGTAMSTFMKFIAFFMPDAFMKKIIHHNKKESLYAHMPNESLPVEFLPSHYEGPNSGSLQDIKEQYIKEITQPDFRQMMLERTSETIFGYDRSKKTETTQGCQIQ